MADLGLAETIKLQGLAGKKILIEAALLNGLPNFTIVGLPDTSVNEARERLRAGFQALGLTWPNRRLIINLSPADTAKSGSGFDLGIAVAVINALGYGNFPPHTALFGEIGLDGSVRGVRGILPAVLNAKKMGFDKAVVPSANKTEAALVSGIEILAVAHPGEVAALLGVPNLPRAAAEPQKRKTDAETPARPDWETCAQEDLNEVCGQEEAIFALQVGAVGRHHLQMVGAPGVGKTMLARRFVGILPPLTAQEAMEVAAVRSLDGEQITALPDRRPFVAPHHSTSAAALIGGGSGVPKMGAITRAHRGVLYCDEFPEFRAESIQALRQPLESGTVDLLRARAHVRYPASFQLITAANPCKCGYLSDSGGKCSCTAKERVAYRNKIGGPIADRIDLHLTVRRPTEAGLRLGGTVSTAEAAARVIRARQRSLFRNRRIEGITQPVNACLPGKWLRGNCRLSAVMYGTFSRLLQAGEISLRGVDRTLRIAFSLADLREKDTPGDDEIYLALQMRGAGIG